MVRKNILKVKDKELFFIVVIVLLICTFCIFVLFKSYDFSKLTGVELGFFYAMRVYLLFLFVRLLGHLFFSFANHFFAKTIDKLDYYPLVTVIIPCFNEEKVINNAAKSILSMSYPNIEILIVDDGSSDSTIEVVSLLEKKGRIRAIHQENAGKAAALNRAVSEAHGDYVLCMDADSVLNTEAIEVGIKYFEHDAKVAAVAGSVEIGNVHNAITSFQKLEYISGLNLFKVAQSFLGSVIVIPGPIGLFRKDILLEVGGYHSNTFAEDCELTIRLLMAGYKTVYDAKMVAVTEAPDDFNSLISQRYRWNRGIVQAIRENIIWLFLPYKSLKNFFIIIYMILESIFIPVANFGFGMFSIAYTLIHSSENFVGYFFFQLVILDIIVTLFCIVTEKRSYSLLFYSAINRITYSFSLEVVRFFSILDEFLKLPMNWAKLERKGMDQ
ncbi:glycosyltransferase family 2 protein [Pigmentibacter ruber]|uniref:glycosyltransferase family 2 protein n=1 Tax=Pigmentibacter ruber TaxID=2683196 RepID=UPI00131EB90B|nr:glycosyltransferase [Pigmentibacter ruber]BFD32528.1 hypothetical protein GTC16762_21460 [Pigmentibacter ruber]